ncbi:hypothetical protein R5R35_002141 [Gryllus longicercus]|uniref:ZAD domain-containing protein n=1 Tax=Gryllus longicercus TaxID=2509291 RepID=A0AAN9VES1_9ORTH
MEWKDWCRLCANTDDNSSPVFQNEDQLLPEKIFKYLSITIRNQDELPQTVCDACTRRVTAFDRYAHQCLRVQTMFKALLQEKDDDSYNKAVLLREEYLGPVIQKRDDQVHYFVFFCYTGRCYLFQHHTLC